MHCSFRAGNPLGASLNQGHRWHAVSCKAHLQAVMAELFVVFVLELCLECASPHAAFLGSKPTMHPDDGKALLISRE
jgi:hypothetical protein